MNVTNAKFLLVNQSANFNSLVTDGILGLTPGFIDADIQPGGELLISKLNSSRIISSAVFALQLGRITEQSRLHLGGWNETSVLAEYSVAERAGRNASSLINWMNLTSPNYWQVSLGEVKTYGVNNTNSLSLLPSNIDAVFDSGSSYSYVPTKDYAVLIKQLVRTTDVNCTRQASTGLTYCNCTRVSDPKFANMTLKLGNRYLLSMNSTEYLSWDPVRKQCLLTILEDGDNSLKHWVLGVPFLRGYYVIHDMENKRIGFAGKNVDLGEPPVPVVKKSTQKVEEPDWWNG